MRILLYNPDNGVTRNFMPHLWMFLLQALTPAGHEVLLIDGNAQRMDETGVARFVRFPEDPDVADAAIVCGVAVLVLQSVVSKRKGEGERAPT